MKMNAYPYFSRTGIVIITTTITPCCWPYSYSYQNLCLDPLYTFFLVILLWHKMCTSMKHYQISIMLHSTAICKLAYRRLIDSLSETAEKKEQHKSFQRQKIQTFATRASLNLEYNESRRLFSAFKELL